MGFYTSQEFGRLVLSMTSVLELRFLGAVFLGFRTVQTLEHVAFWLIKGFGFSFRAVP